MAHLSVNINKLATLRNARGHNNPDILKAAMDIERFGAAGITVHPRPDERHIRYSDVYELKKVVKGEFNIEGNCRDQSFIDLVLANKPTHSLAIMDGILSQTRITCGKSLVFLKRKISGYLFLLTRMQKWWQQLKIRVPIASNYIRNLMP